MFVAPLVLVLLGQVPDVSLTGTVVGRGGEPVIGAELILVGLPSYDPPIVARGKSGEAGRFVLNRPAGLAGDLHEQSAPILWAVKPGFRASLTRFPEKLPNPDEPVRIVLEPPGRAEVRVVNPDGQLLGGVKVLPGRLKSGYTTVPDAVAELVSATTGPDGRAVIEAVPASELTYVDVHSREFGIQGQAIVPVPRKPAAIALRPVSTWKGRLTAADARHARGWRVKAWTRVAVDRSAPAQTAGYVETTTDDNGQFALSPIAIGALHLELKAPAGLPVMADIPQSLSVRGGRPDSVDIALKPAATVTGVVIERGTGKPVPEVSVSLSFIGHGRNDNQTVKTDERGRYTLQSLPGSVRIVYHFFPRTHAPPPGPGFEDFTVPDPPRVIELAPREVLTAAAPVYGKVIDEADHGVAGALVQALWRLTAGSAASDGTINTTTNEQGNFVLKGLGPGSTVTIMARFRDHQTRSAALDPRRHSGPGEDRAHTDAGARRGRPRARARAGASGECHRYVAASCSTRQFPRLHRTDSV